MAKRKLTEKLKKQIKENPYRLRQADFSGDALKYLHKVRGARKAVKTKEEKKRYKEPRRKKEGAPPQVSDLIKVAADSKGMTVKQFRKKYPKEISDFETTGKLYYNREMDQVVMDVKFLPKGTSVYLNGKRVRRAAAMLKIKQVKYKAMQTGLTYERMNMEVNYDAKGNIYLELPTSKEMNNEDLGEGNELLDHIEENYPISFYRK